MRLIPLLTALLIAAGLYYWFGVRHDAGTGPVGEPGGVAMAVRPDAPLTQAPLAEPAPDGDAAADAGAPDPRDTPVPVVVLPSQARPTSAELTLRGRTRPDRSVQVAAETTGRVISAPIRRGATVAEGQVLCRLDTGTRDAELAEVEAALAEARVQESGAAQLARKGYTADTELKQRQAQLRAAQARLDKVTADIAKLEIRAPFDGVLETDTAELGTLLAPGALCAEVVDLDPVTVQSYVSEQEVDRLSLGQRAQVRLVNGMATTGEITFISRSGDEQTRTFDVETTVANPDRQIRAGVTAEVLVALPLRLAHLVPQTALTLDDDGRLGVRVAQDGIVRFHAASILDETPDGVWIDGLPQHADVIVIGQEFVREGRRVEATPVSDSAIATQAPDREASPDGAAAGGAAGSADATIDPIIDGGDDGIAPAAVEATGAAPQAGVAPDGASGVASGVASGRAPVMAPEADLARVVAPVVPEPDAATDAKTVSGAASDATSDAGPDATSDAMSDAAPDETQDAAPDANQDAAPDAGGFPIPVARPDIDPDRAASADPAPAGGRSR